MQDPNDALVDYMEAMNELVAAAGELYPRRMHIDGLEIFSRNVDAGWLPISHAAIAIKAATVNAVDYHAGMFLYEGELLCAVHSLQFAVISAEELDPGTLKSIAEQARAKTKRLEQYLQADTPAA